MTTKIIMNSDDVEEFIKTHFGQPIHNFKINVGEVWVGYGPSEHKQSVFQGIEFEIDNSIRKTPITDSYKQSIIKSKIHEI